MTRSNLYSILCTMVRLAAVYLFVQAAIGLVDMLMHLRHDAVLLWNDLADCAVLALLALLLWMFPGPLVRIAASRRSLEHFESDIEPHTLQYIAFATLGLWFAITGAMQLAYTVHRWFFLDAYLGRGFPDPRGDPKVFGTLLQEIVEIMLGVGLALGSRGLVVLLARLRHGAAPRVQTEIAPSATEMEP